MEPSRAKDVRTKRPVGCLGCLGRLLALCVLGAVAAALIAAVFAPWSFFLGGHFHLLPIWEGTARLKASSGEYVLSFWISPQPGGRTYNFPYFTGWARLCTPRGERYSLRVTGGMHEHPGTDTNGKDMHLEFYRRPWYYGLSGNWDRRPRLDLRGRWENPDLVMSDGGSLSRAFLPDGTLYQGPPQRQPAARETLRVVFHETALSLSLPGCPAQAP
jgi:hypothetical protein